MNSTIPHVRVVVGFCLLTALGYLGFSIWMFGWTVMLCGAFGRSICRG